VGKGDRKTRRGKIYRGSFGKSRPKDPDKDKDKKRAPAKTSSTKK
jgi:30S ribosomal protein S31